MKKTGRRLWKIAGAAALAAAGRLLALLLVRAAGQAVNRRTPTGGINASRMIPINGAEQ